MYKQILYFLNGPVCPYMVIHCYLYFSWSAEISQTIFFFCGPLPWLYAHTSSIAIYIFKEARNITKKFHQYIFCFMVPQPGLMPIFYPLLFIFFMEPRNITDNFFSFMVPTLVLCPQIIYYYLYFSRNSTGFACQACSAMRSGISGVFIFFMEPCDITNTFFYSWILILLCYVIFNGKLHCT